MSSWVGPIPPVVNTYLYSFLTLLIVSTIASSISGITLTSWIFTPKEFSHKANVLVFASWVLPYKISLPIIITAALTCIFFFIIKYIVLK